MGSGNLGPKPYIKGTPEHCDKHDRDYLPGSNCFGCLAEASQKRLEDLVRTMDKAHRDAGKSTTVFGDPCVLTDNFVDPDQPRRTFYIETGKSDPEAIAEFVRKIRNKSPFDPNSLAEALAGIKYPEELKEAAIKGLESIRVGNTYHFGGGDVCGIVECNCISPMTGKPHAE